MSSPIAFAIASFISEFEGWLFGDFRRALITAAPEISEVSDLTAAIRPWIDELVGRACRGMFENIPPGDAAKLHCFVSHALNMALRVTPGFCGHSYLAMCGVVYRRPKYP